MTGRGIDQILPHPGDPTLYEPSVKSSLDYVKFAERASGPIDWPVDFSYIWGDALDIFQREKPQAKIINLETAITRNDVHWHGKEIHYKMSPENVGCLTAAGIDCCILANNHMLDWGIPGLIDSLKTLDQARNQARRGRAKPARSATTGDLASWRGLKGHCVQSGFDDQRHTHHLVRRR